MNSYILFVIIVVHLVELTVDLAAAPFLAFTFSIPLSLFFSTLILNRKQKLRKKENFRCPVMNRKRKKELNSERNIIVSLH
jgi:hypothetical protein